MMLSVELSPNSIDKAVKALRTYAKGVQKATEFTVSNVAKLGAVEAASRVNDETGELSSSIRDISLSPAHHQVVADSKHAAFHEFGTGVVGQGSYRYPFPVPWSYHPRPYKTAYDPNDPDKWFYVDPQDDKWKSTRGQKGQAYMAQAAESMRQAVLPTIKEAMPR